MHNFPCTPDCPLEIWADWLEDHGIDPGEIRLMASGWGFISIEYDNDYGIYFDNYGCDYGCNYSDGTCDGGGYDICGNGYDLD